MKTKNIIIAIAALVVGVAAGWFAARAWGKGECENVEVCKYGNMETANAGRARSPSAPNENSKPRRKAPIHSSADAEVQKRILENKISYLEKCIAAAKGVDAKPAENNHVTNAEIVERVRDVTSFGYFENKD